MMLSGVLGWPGVVVFARRAAVDDGFHRRAVHRASCRWPSWLFGGTMNSVLFTMPAVVYTGGLSAAIHLVNYYRHARAAKGLAGLAERGLRAAWVPCLLSAGTTSLGLISLCTSAIVPIRTFGFYSAVGEMAAVGLIFLYLPAALQLWPPPQHEDPEPEKAEAALDRTHRRRMPRLGRAIIARPNWVWAVFMSLMIVCGAGLYRMKTTVNLMSLFLPDAPIIDNYRWLEAKIGADGPAGSRAAARQAVDQADAGRAAGTGRPDSRGDRRRCPHVGSSLSAVTFVPDLTPRKRGGVGRAC